MAIWQWALLLLGCVWAIQAIGVWFQMRHYADVFKGISNRFSDGFVGAGHARGRFGKGTIVLIVVTPDLIVRRVMTMTGRSVFAKFERQHRYEGIPLHQLRSGQPDAAAGGGGFSPALAKAIEQIDRARRDAQGGGVPGLDPAHA